VSEGVWMGCVEGMCGGGVWRGVWRGCVEGCVEGCVWRVVWMCLVGVPEGACWRGVCGEVCVKGCVKGAKAVRTERQSLIQVLDYTMHLDHTHRSNSQMKLTWHSLHSHPQLPTLLQTSSRH